MTLEDLGAEATPAVLRNTQLELSCSGNQVAGVIAAVLRQSLLQFLCGYDSLRLGHGISFPVDRFGFG